MSEELSRDIPKFISEKDAWPALVDSSASAKAFQTSRSTNWTPRSLRSTWRGTKHTGLRFQQAPSPLLPRLGAHDSDHVNLARSQCKSCTRQLCPARYDGLISYVESLADYLQVLRYSALVLGIFYGFTHQRTLNTNAKAAQAEHEYKHKESLIQKAKREYAKKHLPPQSKTPDGGGKSLGLPWRSCSENHVKSPGS